MKRPEEKSGAGSLIELRNSHRARLYEVWQSGGLDAMRQARAELVTQAHYKLYRTLDSAREASSMLEVAAEFSVATNQLEEALEDHFEATYLMGSHENQAADLGRLNATLGSLYDGLNRHDEAMGHYQVALTHLKKDPSTMALQASVLNNIAMTLKHEGDLEGAKQAYDESLQMLEPLQTSDPEMAATLKYNYAVLLQETGQDDVASEYFLEALDDRTEALGKDHPDTGLSHVSVAIVYALGGDEEAALRHFAAAEPVLRKKLPSMRDEYEALIANYTIFLRNQGRYAEAEALEAQANAALA